MFSARRGFMDHCRFFGSHCWWFRLCPGQSMCLKVPSLQNILVQRRCSKQLFCSTKSALSCFVQWPPHGATLCLVCSAKLGFVSSFGMCRSHVDVFSALEKHWSLIGRNCRKRARHMSSMFCLVQKRSLTHKDLCNMIRVARQMDAKLLLSEPCRQRLSAGSGKTFRQLR